MRKRALSPHLRVPHNLGKIVSGQGMVSILQNKISSAFMTASCKPEFSTPVMFQQIKILSASITALCTPEISLQVTSQQSVIRAARKALHCPSQSSDASQQHCSRRFGRQSNAPGLRRPCNCAFHRQGITTFKEYCLNVISYITIRMFLIKSLSHFTDDHVEISLFAIFRLLCFPYSE